MKGVLRLIWYIVCGIVAVGGAALLIMRTDNWDSFLKYPAGVIVVAATLYVVYVLYKDLERHAGGEQ